jgi:hypothetical protein
LTKIILKKIQKKNKKKRKFWKKIKIQKKHEGKIKAKFSTISILKKLNSTKIILKKHLEKYYTKRKTLWEKFCSNLQLFLLKNYKIKFSTSSI